MSGRSARMRSTFWYSLRPSSTAMTSMIIAPAPSAARCADSRAHGLNHAPQRSFASPPPADDVLKIQIHGRARRAASA